MIYNNLCATKMAEKSIFTRVKKVKITFIDFYYVRKDASSLSGKKKQICPTFIGLVLFLSFSDGRRRKCCVRAQRRAKHSSIPLHSLSLSLSLRPFQERRERERERGVTDGRRRKEREEEGDPSGGRKEGREGEREERGGWRRKERHSVSHPTCGGRRGRQGGRKKKLCICLEVRRHMLSLFFAFPLTKRKKTITNCAPSLIAVLGNAPVSQGYDTSNCCCQTTFFWGGVSGWVAGRTFLFVCLKVT